MNLQESVKSFLEKAPAKFVTVEKAVKPAHERIPVDRYGLRSTSKMAHVNAAIAALVDAGRIDAILPESLCTILGATAKEEKARIGGHLAWFNRKMIYSDTKGDFIPRPTEPVKTLAQVLAEKAAANQAAILAETVEEITPETPKPGKPGKGK